MTNFRLTVKRTNKVMDAPIQAGDMLIQNKDADNRKVYIATEVLGEIKLVNINSGKTYNIEGYVDETRQDVVDIVSDHFYKYSWTFVPVENIKSKDIAIVAYAD